MISKYEDMIILYPNMIYFDVPSWRNMKDQALQNSHLHKNLESTECSNKKHEKPTLHSLIANHVLEMSIKLKFQCVCLKKKHRFALVALNMFPICFYQGLFTRCDLYHRMLLYHYAETKEVIDESVNLKGVVYEPKHNSFSLHSITYK